MSNPQTAEEWKTVAANASAQIKEISAQAAAATASEAAAVAAAQAEYNRLRVFSSNPNNFDLKTPEGIAAFKAAKAEATAYRDNQLNAALEAQSNAEQQYTSQINQLRQTQANADRQASAALAGPPQTSPNTPPSTSQPNTDPTTVTTTTVPNASVISPKPVSDETQQTQQTTEDAPAAKAAQDINSNTDPGLPQANPADFGATGETGAAENFEPKPVDPDNDPVVRDFFEQTRQEAEARAIADEAPDSEANARTKAWLKETQEQASIQQFFNQTTKGDWRVRLRIAPDADYLYQDKSNALLAPLRASDGVVFPYTPTINTSYAARYDPYDLTHSNYRGYFYRGSQVSDVQIQATFTAQDTREAEYVLAVIQFFRSATKMFYGKDQQRGSPPPLVYLRGYGEYQFNDHACVITNFQYNLPNDVDYIAVTPNNIGLNLSNRQNQVGSSPVSTISSAIGRLGNLFNAVTGQPGVPKGAAPGDRGDLGLTRQTVNGIGQATYVPTKIDMNITLLPIQTRSQVSKQFSVKEFANGNLLKKGFW